MEEATALGNPLPDVDVSSPLRRYPIYLPRTLLNSFEGENSEKNASIAPIMLEGTHEPRQERALPSNDG